MIGISSVTFYTKHVMKSKSKSDQGCEVHYIFMLNPIEARRQLSDDI